MYYKINILKISDTPVHWFLFMCLYLQNQNYIFQVLQIIQCLCFISIYLLIIDFNTHNNHLLSVCDYTKIFFFFLFGEREVIKTLKFVFIKADYILSVCVCVCVCVHTHTHAHIYIIVVVGVVVIVIINVVIKLVVQHC